MKHNVGEYRVS